RAVYDKAGQPGTGAGARARALPRCRAPADRLPEGLIQRRCRERMRRRRPTLDVVSARFAGVAIAIVALAFLFALFQPLPGDGGKRVRVVIPPHSSTGDIGAALDRQGVVPSAALFELRAKLAGNGGELKPGTYYL